MENIIVIHEKELKAIIKDCFQEFIGQTTTKNQDSDLEIMNPKEAAKFLKISVATIYFYTSKRLIPFAKAGKSLRFSRTDLLKWLDENKRKTIVEYQINM